MASSFATQLRTIAQNSTNELDIRARQTAHAESLLFPRDIAAKQDFDTIYAVCIQGFRELCSLDSTFIEFERNLFSAQSVRTEREQMSKAENDALDTVLERCLIILGGRVLLKPGLRCLEWLVRRFRVHTYNTSALLLAVLLWHETPIWKNILSIVPKEKCTGEWKMLGLYKSEALNVPRSAIVHALTNNDGFFALLNRYIIGAARDGLAHAGLLKFWIGVTVEAVTGRLDAARSGRREIQRQRTEDILLKILPVLSDGFEVLDCPDLTTACFTLSMVLAGKADLDDRVLDTLLQTVTGAADFPDVNQKAVLVTVIVIAGQKQRMSVPKLTLEYFMHLKTLEATLSELKEMYPVGTLIEALVGGSLSGVKRKNLTVRLSFIERLLRFSNTLTQQILSTTAQIVLARILEPNGGNETDNNIRTGLIEILQRLNEERSMSLAISEASKRLQQEPSTLEALLGSAVLMIEATPDGDADKMELDLPVVTVSDADDLLQKIPTRTADTISFMAKHDLHLYEQLADCYASCYRSKPAIQKFARLPIWQSLESEELLLVSFLLKIAVGPFNSGQKMTALQLIAQALQNADTTSDLQALLPYVLTALSDSSQLVRKSAADLIIVIEKSFSGGDDSTKRFGSDQLYEHSNMEQVHWIAAAHVKKIISQVISPSLEECVLDASQIVQIIRFALNGSDTMNQTPTKSNVAELKKSLRHDLFNMITSHAIATPSWNLKISIFHLLDSVNKVGSSTKSKSLAPILQLWSSFGDAAAKQLAESEGLQLPEIDAAVSEVITSQDKDSVGNSLAMLEGESSPRADFITAIFGRIQRIWKDLRHETSTTTSLKLYELAFRENSPLSKDAQGVLRSVKLNTEILSALLEQSAGGITRVQDEDEQPKKRRRISNGRDSLPPDLSRVVRATCAQLTFALELVDDSSPESKPELLPVLFDVLAMLKRLKQQQKLSVPYLHNLCLSGILAIVDAQRNLAKPTIDTSSIRADLVTGYVVSSDNTQVQTTAILLCASLASIAPDRMLHNVMPIFTIMGQNLFSKEDEHSVYVVNQAIDQIIPALVGSLRHQNKDLIKSTSSLLASFTAAYDHIPRHRRVATYSRLLDRMGAQEFAFVVIAMLAQRKGSHPTFGPFFTDLLNELDTVTQLHTLAQSINLATDVLSADPSVADEVFAISDTTATTERQAMSRTMFNVIMMISRSKSLKAKVSRLHKMDIEAAETVRNGINTCFRLLLVTIRDLRKNSSVLVEEAKHCLDALLQLPSLAELFTILPEALESDQVDEDLKPQALRILATQLQVNAPRDSKTRAGALELLAKLTEMLENGSDIAMKQAIIVCIDRLSDVYGRKDLEIVTAAAGAISSDVCLGSGDRRLEVMSLLSLASMLEVLGEACIPILPGLLDTFLQILRDTVKNKTDDEDVHNASFALVGAIVSHVSFLISDEHLQALLVLASLAAPKYRSESAVASRKEALSVFARKIDLTTLLTILLGEDLNVVREHPEDAEIEKLDMLALAIEAATKASIVKNAEHISQLLLAHLDQRSRLFSQTDVMDEGLMSAVIEIENKVNNSTIQFIYKLNDTAFRPIFESWVEWATNAYDVEHEVLREQMKPLRQQSLFSLLAHFFDTLKSIVTSYSAYLTTPAHDILTTSALPSMSRKPIQPLNINMYKSFLTMLRAAFTHDVDAFFTTPSHFDPIAAPLIANLNLATTKPLRSLISTHLIPTITSLAIATLDTPAHHQTLSHALVQLRHSTSAAVRLASIQTFAALTAHEDVGEEFIANVIGIGSGEGEGARGIGGGGAVGEVMIYVNEMLEDDDEEVEREVRRWVQVVRERTGEDVFEV